MKKAFPRFLQITAWVLCAFCLLCCVVFTVQGWPKDGKMATGSGKKQAVLALYEGDKRLSLLNSLTAQELTKASGVGTALAEKIIAARPENGGFAFLEELQQVSGIGEKKYQAILALLDELLAGE